MSTTDPNALTHVPVARDKLLELVNVAKSKQVTADADYEARKQAYIEHMLHKLERITYSVDADDIWNGSNPDGTLILSIPPDVEKPPMLFDWAKYESIIQLDARPYILVPNKLLSILVEETNE